MLNALATLNNLTYYAGPDSCIAQRQTELAECKCVGWNSGQIKVDIIETSGLETVLCAYVIIYILCVNKGLGISHGCVLL